MHTPIGQRLLHRGLLPHEISREQQCLSSECAIRIESGLLNHRGLVRLVQKSFAIAHFCSTLSETNSTWPAILGCGWTRSRQPGGGSPRSRTARPFSVSVRYHSAAVAPLSAVPLPIERMRSPIPLIEVSSPLFA